MSASLSDQALFEGSTPNQVRFDLTTRRLWIASSTLFFIGVAFMIVLAIGLFLAVALEHSFRRFPIFSQPVPTSSLDWIYPAAAYTGFIVFPFVAFIPIIIPLALMWKNPQRIVMFRQFHSRRENKQLKRIVARHLGRFGHVFTLADSHIHQSLLVRVPVILGQLSFLHFRPRKIRDAGGLTDLQRAIDERWRLNMNWIVSRRKVFPIESSDDCWKACVDLLLEKADLVVVDISWPSESLDWEIAECQRRNLLSRTILLVNRDKVEERTAMRGKVAALRDQFGIDVEVQQSLFVYGRKGLEKPAKLRSRVGQILSRSETPRRPISIWKVALTIIAPLCFSLALASAVLLVTAPYQFPNLAGRYSPFNSRILAAYLQTGSGEILSRLSARDREWTVAMLRQVSTRDARAMTGLGQIGDEREISFLIGLIDGQSTTIRSASAEFDALTMLVQRLGKPALDPLLAAISSAQQLPFNEGLYSKYINVYATEPESLERLLASPNQAGRYMAALEMPPQPRTVPIMLAILRSFERGSPHHKKVDEALRTFWTGGFPGLDLHSLDPFILENDSFWENNVAARHAARLALASDDEAYLARILQQVPESSGHVLLMELVDVARGNNAALADRAHRLLAGADAMWATSLLSASHYKTVRISAAYAKAERGDPAVLGMIASAMCERLLFGWGCSEEDENLALDALALLRDRSNPPQRLAVRSELIAELTSETLSRLIRLLAKSEDLDALGRVLGLLHPSPGSGDYATLIDVGERLEKERLSLLVKQIPRTLRTEQTAFVSALAEGRASGSFSLFRAPSSRVDSGTVSEICAALNAAQRPDLNQAWRSAGYRCPLM